MPRPFSFLIALLLAAITAVLAAPNPILAPRAGDSSQSVLSGQSATGCSYTKQCDSCESSLGYRGNIQCCWPRGVGGGSPFTQPGYCLCAPPGLNEYSLCLGGSWLS